jgi:Ser/Thr protein kinase RdoA (MazF antagonist)
MRFQAKLLDHLGAHGYPAHDPVAEPSPGDGYDPANPAHLPEAGRGLARYHAVVRSFPYRLRAQGRPALPALEHRGPYVLATFAGVAEAYLGPAGRARLTRASSFLWSQFIRVPEALMDVLPGLSRLVIHGAYNRSALTYRGDRLAGVTGYDFAGYDLRAVDLGVSLDAFAGVMEDGAVGLDLERCASLMAAYREVESLPPQELAALPLLFRAQRLTGVLTGTTRFLQRHELVSQPDEETRHLVDMVEREADRARWLEAGEQELFSALSLVG